MALKYKKGDLVILGDLEPPFSSDYIKGDSVTVVTLCNEDLSDEHYEVKTCQARYSWWISDFEIDHQATESANLMPINLNAEIGN